MEETKVPGILLLVTGALTILTQLASIGWGGFLAVTGGEQVLPQAIGTIVGGLIGIVCGAFIAFGGLKLKNGESYNLAMAACVLAMLPFCSGACCLLGLPAGIMGILAMRKDEVKNNFR